MVQSPLQIINAYEATSYLSKNHNIFYFIFCQKEKQTNAQMFNTLKELNIKPFCVISFSNNAFLKILFWLKNLFYLYKIQEISRFYVGDYMAGQLVSSSNLFSRADLFLLDDGTSSYNFEDFRYKNLYPQYLPRSKKISLLRFDPFLPSQVTFFSMYDINVKSPDLLIRNKLSSFSKLVSSNEFGPIFFIGCPLLEVKVISSHLYYNYMSKFFQLYGHQKVIYFPHRREILDKQKLDFLAQYSVEIYNQTLPFEIELVKINLSPSKIVTFFSSAFDTLSLIYNQNLDVLFSLRISTDLIDDIAYKQVAQSSYKKYENTKNIHLIDL